jgi:phytoene desaturase
MATIFVIGAGFSGISAATTLASEGHEVHVYEKHDQPGGRARQLRTDNGYTFDMGPSWYWMPDVFEQYFRRFGHTISELYDLKLLNPSFDVIFPEGKGLSIPADFPSLQRLFESLEPGSAVRLTRFMEEAAYKYKTGIGKLVYKPGLSMTEFMDKDVIRGMWRLQLFSSFSKHVRKYFSHPHLIALMEFPVLFLGAMPADTPALYSLMNYAGLNLGTWYPMGGFGKVIEAMETVAIKQGVQFHYSQPIERILIDQKKCTGIQVDHEIISCDAIIASADYHHAEQLLPPDYRNYSEAYWSKKTFAPSALIYYLGINKRIHNLRHHNLFFDEDLTAHAKSIYKQPAWPDKPLFYVCAPSKTDDEVAPAGHENLFLLMPIAPGIADPESIREQYLNIMLDRLEQYTGESIRPHIDYKKSYAVSDFTSDYNAYKGNAYGLANTLSQTAILKPKIRNRRLANLYYTGQLTVPGPGVPPAIISGQLVADQLHAYLTANINHEVTV